MRREVMSFGQSLRPIYASEPEDEQVLVPDYRTVICPSHFLEIQAGELCHIPHEDDICDHCKRNLVALFIFGQRRA